MFVGQKVFFLFIKDLSSLLKFDKLYPHYKK